MKFALTILIGFACVISTFTAPAENLVRSKIERIFDIFKSKSSDNPIVATVINLMSRECIEEKYKTYKLETYLDDGYFPIDGVIMVTHYGQTDGFVIFTLIAATCFERKEAVLEFVFDAFKAVTKLIFAFKNDHELLKKGFAFMPCFVNYAVENELIDTTEYPTLDLSYGNITKDECKKLTGEMDQALDSASKSIGIKLSTSQDDCLTKILKQEAQHITIKYGVLMLSNSVSDSQVEVEKALFVREYLNYYTSLIKCFDDQEEVTGNTIDVGTSTDSTDVWSEWKWNLNFRLKPNKLENRK